MDWLDELMDWFAETEKATAEAIEERAEWVRLCTDLGGEA